MLNNHIKPLLCWLFAVSLLMVMPRVAYADNSAQQKAEVKKSLETLKKKIKSAKSIQDYEQLKTEFSKVKNKSTWIADNPNDPLALEFKSNALKVLEVTEPNAYLNKCAGGNSQLTNKVNRWNQSWVDDIQKSQLCENPNDPSFKKGANDLYKISTAIDQKNTLYNNLTNPYYGMTNGSAIGVRLGLEQSQRAGDIKANNGIRDPINPQIQKEKQKDFDEQIYKIQRQNGYDAQELGKESQNYINQKYGIFDQKDEKNKALKASQLHDELMQRNRENCLNNYMFYSQHFDFSDEPALSKENPLAGVRSKFDKMFCVNDNTCPSVSSDQRRATEESVMKNYSSLEKKYGKARLSIDDVYDRLLPIFNSYGADSKNVHQQIEKLKKDQPVRSLDNDYGTISKLYSDNRNQFQLVQLSQAQQKALDQAKNSELGFLLHTKVFKGQWENLHKMTPEQIKNLLKESLKSAVQNTEDYANEFIKPNQSNYNFYGMTATAKSSKDYAQTDQTLLFSSPKSIERTIANDLSLFGSLCEPIKQSKKNRTIETPDWVEFGGGAMLAVSFVPGIGQAANIAFQVAATTAQVVEDQKKKNAIQKDIDYGYTGDALADVDYNDKDQQEKINQSENEKFSDHQTGLVKKTTISLVATYGTNKYLKYNPKDPIAAKKIRLQRQANAAELETGKISTTQLDDLTESHFVGMGEPGKIPGTLAKANNYTREQIIEKYRILRKSYSPADAKRLMKESIAGADEAEVNAYMSQYEEQYAQYDYKNYVNKGKPTATPAASASNVEFDVTHKATKNLAKADKMIQKNYEDWIEKVNQNGLNEVRKIPGYHDESIKQSVNGYTGCRSVRLTQGVRLVYRETKANGKTTLEIICIANDCYKH